MKKLGLFFTMMVGAFFLLTTNVMAQESVTASATATAEIVAPLAISKTVDMVFGNVSAGASGGTVVLAPAGTRSVTGTVQLAASATGSPTAASFSVTGEGAYTYSITLPSVDYTISDSEATPNTMTVNTFTSDPTPTGTLTAGAQTLTVGATLNVSASQVEGTYTNATGFDVTVAYN